MADQSVEERLAELELEADERLVKLENLGMEEALKTIGESLQTLGKAVTSLQQSMQTLDKRLFAIEKWRKS